MATMRERWTDERMDDLSEGMHREFAEVHTELRANGRKIDALGTELRGQIGSLGSELRGEVDALGTELRGEIDAWGPQLRAEIGVLGNELRGEIGSLGTALRGEIDARSTELRGEIGVLRGEMNEGFRDLNWTMVFGFGSIVASVLGGAVAAILAHAL